MLVTLSTLAVVIIFALAFYAVYLLRKVKQYEREQAKVLAEQTAKQKAQQDYIVESLRVISANVLDEDLNLSEATIRCKVLLDALLLPTDIRQTYQILDDVFEQIQYFDTHQARKALSKDARKQQDERRIDIENKYQTELRMCFKTLRNFQL